VLSFKGALVLFARSAKRCKPAAYGRYFLSV